MNHTLSTSHQAVTVDPLANRPTLPRVLLLITLLALLAAGLILPWGSGGAPDVLAALVPTATPTAAASATPDPAQREAALALAWEGVSRNDDWTPYSEVRANSIEYVLVPRGCFMMGSTPAQVEAAHAACVAVSGAENCPREWYTREAPQHRVCIDTPFWISRYEITNAQYQECVDLFACSPSACAQFEDFGGPQQPAVCINWFNAGYFAVWSAGRGAHGRLPSEAEWEYAARGPDGLLYPWGGKDPTCDLLNYWGGESGCVSATTDGGSYSPQGDSWVGAADMAGNTGEWTSTLFAPYPYDASDGREFLPDEESPRVIRGGSWLSNNRTVRAATRGSIPPLNAFELQGIRVVIPAEEP